ncbi:MAG: hypothetical protein FD123_848 [Bacteroidetes bacterium]|nr:MAG: hypothetical protein FD123_848 [Bacteroidota bacterium]
MIDLCLIFSQKGEFLPDFPFNSFIFTRIFARKRLAVPRIYLHLRSFKNCNVMKKGLGEYIISFSSLKPGRYEYEFEVDDTFFEHFEQTEITHGSLAVKLEVQRQPMMLALAFNITGEVELTCDRCGDLYRQPVSGHRRLVVHIGGEERNTSTSSLSCLPRSGAFIPKMKTANRAVIRK